MQLPCSHAACLRFVSWNVHGLPFKSDTTTRLRRVAEKIKEQQPDVVFLQEVWFGRYARLLEHVLSPDYQPVFAPRPILGWPRGGLVILVRQGSAWRPDEVRYQPVVASA